MKRNEMEQEKEQKKEQEKEQESILVLATAQKNSLRLIDQGVALGAKLNKNVHILHIQSGNSIFDGKDNLKQLQRLMHYGISKGAYVHLACDTNLKQAIQDFINKNQIAYVVMGEPTSGLEATFPEDDDDGLFSDIFRKIRVCVIEKEGSKVYPMIG